jgi:Oxidoreductase family, NAD-binding Rossmann fold
MNPAPTSPSPSESGRVNMCGHVAPRLETVRVGIVGLGQRGLSMLERLLHVGGVEITAICAVRESQVEQALAVLRERGRARPAVFNGGEDDWKALCDRPDVDIVYVFTQWSLHTPIALRAMECGKHAAVEVPAATTLDDCWRLVETSERTRRHCRMLENCCYDFVELLTLNMARQGFFGEIVHAEGAYIHNIIEENFSKSAHHELWRLKENFRKGNLYPTHGLGPLCQVMNINRGERMDYLVSVSTEDFTMGAKARELAASDPFYLPFAGRSFRGNMNSTLIRTVSGRTILLQHDTSSPRPYSRIHLISGTKAFVSKFPEPERFAVGEQWLGAEAVAELREKYTPEILSRIGKAAEKIGGHGGMDFLMNWRIVDCLRNGLPMDDDVYDAALWSAIAPLTEASVASRSAAVDVPDFTRGAWKTNRPVDISLKGGGATAVLP